MKQWRTYFLQQQRNVEGGYLAWLLLHWVAFSGALLPLWAVARVPAGSLLAFCFLLGMLLAATRVYVDHYTLCPARSTDEAYRAIQSSGLIWLLFGVGAVFFVSHCNSFFLFFCMVWIAIYAAYLHLRCGRRALKPARDEYFPPARNERETADDVVGRIIDEVIAKRKIEFLSRMHAERRNVDEMIKIASNEFL